ncbi:MAG: precorrin-8X methylmutase [Clostridiales bacterium]|nr:precorrin-8X methylmutase [Clostridiales bacterium]
MKIKYEHVLPMEIEKRSFEIISEELVRRGIRLNPELEPVIKRVIHTTADFEYAETLTFSPDAVGHAKQAIRDGACIVTDTRMAMSGINKNTLEKYGSRVYNFISDEDVAESAKKNQTTRSAACMDKAAGLNVPLIFAVGNAPTALIRLYELIQEGRICPKLVIGVPVGFVNVEYAKELILKTDVPYIVACGRKGGSNVAAAICNAILYQMDDMRGR